MHDTDPPAAEPAVTVEDIKQGFYRNLFNVQGKFPALATNHDYYMALAYTVRELLMARWIATAATYSFTIR